MTIKLDMDRRQFVVTSAALGGGMALSVRLATDADIDKTITNICRCGTYQRIRAAIHLAGKSMKS